MKLTSFGGFTHFFVKGINRPGAQFTNGQIRAGLKIHLQFMSRALTSLMCRETLAAGAIMKTRTIITGVALVLAGAIIAIACSQWRVTTLTPRKPIHIKNGTYPGQVLVKTDEMGFEDLSAGVWVSDGKIITADNEQQRLQVLDPDGDVELVIGNLKNIDRKKIPSAPFTFRTIGACTMDDQLIYVQNRFSQMRGMAKPADASSIDFSPSYILAFNRKGDLQYTLGQKGSPDVPFNHIESLSIDSAGRLVVIAHSFDSWGVYIFKGKKREQYVNLGALSFDERDGAETYKGRIDNVRSYKDGERFLISVAYYHGLRLKYLKIFEYSMEKNGIARTIVQIPDPKNVLFNIMGDKHIYLWNVSSDEIKFIQLDMDGDIVNNLSLELKRRPGAYARIMMDEKGRFFSYHISKDGIEIIQWD